MAGCFRLFDLNEKCIKTVLQCTELFDLISFSLCSKKRLANVRSLKLQIKNLGICCSNIFYARYDFGGNENYLVFCEDGYDREIALSDNRPRRLQVNYIEGTSFTEHLHRQDGNPVQHWRKANFRGNDWLRHFMDIFNCDKIDSMHVQESKFEIDSVVDIVQNLNIANLLTFQNVTKPYTLSLLKAQPCLEDLNVHSLTLDDPSEYSILLRNQQYLTVRTEAKITLDIVLSVNSLTLNCFGLSIKDVNRFIKLWKKGANPRLRCLCVSRYYAHPAAAVVFNENEVLRGVQYKRVPLGTVRMLDVFENRMEIHGGFDITGKSGRKATVILSNQYGYSSLRMYIWQ